MEIVKASLMWSETGVLTLFREPTPALWEADATVDPSGWDIILLRTLDETEQDTGEIAGVEIVGFREFSRWQDLPRLPILWQLPNQEPLPLDELLKREQRGLLQQVKGAA